MLLHCICVVPHWLGLSNREEEDQCIDSVTFSIDLTHIILALSTPILLGVARFCSHPICWLLPFASLLTVSLHHVSEQPVSLLRVSKQPSGLEKLQVVAVRPLEAPTAVKQQGGGNGGAGGMLMFIWDGTDARPLAPESVFLLSLMFLKPTTVKF
jgi:hypothetical protein